MKPSRNHRVRCRNELKTREIDLGGRRLLDFGTVRPRVQIPGPRPVCRFEVKGPRAWKDSFFIWQVPEIRYRVVFNQVFLSLCRRRWDS
jgi:hypothetical protein